MNLPIYEGVVAWFLDAAYQRIVPPYSTIPQVNPNVDYSFFRDAWTTPYITDPPPLPSTRDAPERLFHPDPRIPHDRLMEAMGSVANEAPLSFLARDLNQLLIRVGMRLKYIELVNRSARYGEASFTC